MVCEIRALQVLFAHRYVILCSNSYGGGADLWANAMESPCYQKYKEISKTAGGPDGGKDDGSKHTAVGSTSKCDGRLEILGVRMVHLATSQVKSGLPSGIKLAHARHVQLRLSGTGFTAMQIDGEPRLQPPGVIEFVAASEGPAVLLQVC